MIIKKSPKRKGDYIISSQAMECQAFLNLLPRLVQDTRIVEVVKDGDLQIDRIIRTGGWQVKLTPGPNHLLNH